MTTAWLAVVVVALGTWAMRAGLVVVFGRVAVPPALQRAFRYVAPSVMAALSVPAFLAPDGTPVLSAGHLMAGIVAVTVAVRWGSFVATLAAGLATYAAVGLVL